MINRILIGLKLFWFGISKPSLFSESVFLNMSKLLEFLLKTSEDDKPLRTYVYIGDRKILSLWAYPGVSKNPVDRIAELLEENNVLKQLVNQFEKNNCQEK